VKKREGKNKGGKGLRGGPRYRGGKGKETHLFLFSRTQQGEKGKKDWTGPFDKPVRGGKINDSLSSVEFPFSLKRKGKRCEANAFNYTQGKKKREEEKKGEKKGENSYSKKGERKSIKLRYNLSLLITGWWKVENRKEGRMREGSAGCGT